MNRESELDHREVHVVRAGCVELADVLAEDANDDSQLFVRTNALILAKDAARA